MQHSPSLEANWFSASQEIPLVLWEPVSSLPHLFLYGIIYYLCYPVAVMLISHSVFHFITSKTFCPLRPPSRAPATLT